MIVPKEYAIAAFAVLLGHLIGGIAWMIRLGGRMSGAETGLDSIKESLKRGDQRMSRLEESQSGQGDRLIAMERDMSHAKDMLVEVRSDQKEILRILNERSRS